ncbi:MAG: histidine kinase [Bacteroidota bacterium]|nr:histidine kinase [Bacteroidota bacterium]
MFESILNKLSHRLIIAFVFGLFGYLITEVIFSLIYRYYNFFGSPQNYFYSILMAYVVVEAMRQIDPWLDKIIPWEGRPISRLSLEILSGTLIALIVVVGFRLFIQFLIGSGFVLLIDELIIVLVTILIIVMIALIGFAYMLLNNWRISVVQLERSKKESAEFQFEMLKSQINPHFLFNSLNTLSSLIYDDKEKASAFIRKLSDVYRRVLDTRNKYLVSLQEELDFIDSYIYLLKIRFDQKLDLHIEIDKPFKERLVAPMTLQLLIENAVKHNIISEKKPLRINIYIEDGALAIVNNLQRKITEEKGSAIGLKNIISRYALVTELNVTFSEEKETFKVLIPLL